MNRFIPTTTTIRLVTSVKRTILPSSRRQFSTTTTTAASTAEETTTHSTSLDVIKVKIDPALCGTKDHPTDPLKPKLGELKSHKVFLEQGKKVYYCTCGHSRTQPFCDNSHRTILNPETNQPLFKPVEFTPPESKIYSFCLCKYSKSIFCDGQHKIYKGWVPKPRPAPAAGTSIETTTTNTTTTNAI